MMREGYYIPGEYYANVCAHELSEQHGVIGSVVAEILEMLCPIPSKCVIKKEKLILNRTSRHKN